MATKRYKLAHLDKNIIRAAARKALIAADPHYYAWPAAKQEQFRASMTKSARKKMDSVLLSNVLNISCTPEEAPKIWRELPIADLNPLNWASLLTAGIGEDYLYLNESMAKGKTLLDFPTLYDYDYADYLFQQAANKRDCPDYKTTPYYAYRHPSWVRLFIDELFYYADFLSLATYVLDQIEPVADALIDKLIPHKYVEGKNHGKAEKSGMLWDMEVDANGQEAQLKELNHRWYTYQSERWLELSEEYQDTPSAVYMIDEDRDNDPHYSFIFANAATLKKLRWQHFLADCRPLLSDFSAVQSQIDNETKKVESWLLDTYQDIQDNFDPKVVALRKKCKIIMTPNALEDMSKLDQE